MPCGGGLDAVRAACGAVLEAARHRPREGPLRTRDRRDVVPGIAATSCPGSPRR